MPDAACAEVAGRIHARVMRYARRMRNYFECKGEFEAAKADEKPTKKAGIRAMQWLHRAAWRP